MTISGAIKDLMKTYVQYPPCKPQSEGYNGPITLSGYERFQYIRDMLQKEDISIPLPTGNYNLEMAAPERSGAAKS